MSAVLITTGWFAEGGHEALERYASAVLPMLLVAGGQLLFRGSPIETLVGDRAADLYFVMRFDSAATIRELLTGEQYLAQVPHRDRAFSSITTVIAEDIV